jgi:hypothetical protein
MVDRVANSDLRGLDVITADTAGHVRDNVWTVPGQGKGSISLSPLTPTYGRKEPRCCFVSGKVASWVWHCANSDRLSLKEQSREFVSKSI